MTIGGLTLGGPGGGITSSGGRKPAAEGQTGGEATAETPKAGGNATSEATNPEGARPSEASTAKAEATKSARPLAGTLSPRYKFCILSYACAGYYSGSVLDPSCIDEDCTIIRMHLG